MTIKQKLAIYLTRQKPMLVYTNGKEYIGLEEFEDKNVKYAKWYKTDINHAYDFSGTIYKIFRKPLTETLSITTGKGWDFTKIQFIKKGDII